MQHWYCIYTKAKCEDQVAHLLRNLPNVEVLNPKIQKKRSTQDRLRDVIEELFPCYIFSRFNPVEHYHTVKYTRGTRRIIGDETGNPYVIDDDIIHQIQSRIEDGFVRLRPPELRAGDPVVIEGGPLHGLTGVFQQRLKARDRVLILLNALACRARVVIAPGYLARR